MAGREHNSKPAIGFVTEQALGHVTYAKNLRDAWEDQHSLQPVWLPVPYAGGGILERLPGTRSNWTLRGSMRAAHALQSYRGRQLDAVFYHTQTVALLAPLRARYQPVIISLDATPLNFDQVGHAYGHRSRAGGVFERAKQRMHRVMFQSASTLTTWSQWAKDSLRDDYGVDSERVTVIHPGVNLKLFPFGRERCAIDKPDPIRILFVGGDFVRKGGPLLLRCMREGLAQRCELHLVTQQTIPSTPGVHVYHDLGPNDPRLLDLYKQADVFALPTDADCLAVVLGEAMASGLPVVTTAVGAHAEAVEHGSSGVLIRPGDANELMQALHTLAADPALRAGMGRRGRAIAEARFDAHVNAARIAAVIHDGIDRWWREHTRGCGLARSPR